MQTTTTRRTTAALPTGLVGFVTIPKATHVARSYETAAWRSTIRLAPGIYPITGKWQDGRLFYGFTVPGVFVDVFMPSLWGGVAVGSEPQGRNHRSVGSETTYRVSCEVTNGYWGQWMANAAETGVWETRDVETQEVVHCPITFLQGLAKHTERFWSCYVPTTRHMVHCNESIPYGQPGRYGYGTPYYGHWHTLTTLLPRLLLTAGK